MQWQKIIDAKVSEAISQSEKKYELLLSEISGMKEAFRAAQRAESPISHAKTTSVSTERTVRVADMTVNREALFDVAEPVAKEDVNLAYSDRKFGHNSERQQAACPDLEDILEGLNTPKTAGVISSSKKRALHVDETSSKPLRRSSRRTTLVDEVVNFPEPLNKQLEISDI